MIAFRIRLLAFFCVSLWLVLMARLGYWQLVRGPELSEMARSQRKSVETVPASRGEIRAKDGYALAARGTEYVLFAYTPQLKNDPVDISKRIAPLIQDIEALATRSARERDEIVSQSEATIISSLTRDRSWIPLARSLDLDQKQAIEKLAIPGLGFDPEETRYYPEASLSAHLLGFVGRNAQGERTGYFGLEGFYNHELAGRSGLVVSEKDGLGRPLLLGVFAKTQSRSGRHLQLHLDRSIQFLVEQQLAKGISQYQAASGEVVVMDPKTGAIIAMASFPHYDPDAFSKSNPALYRNPVVADTYEPGSTFKVMVMASALDQGVIRPDTICDQTCNGPVRIGKYAIKTWNEVYNPGQTMTDVLKRSDNTGMVFVSRQMGKDRMISMLSDFGFTQKTGIDLQEEAIAPLKKRWGEIDLATLSFGQGIAVSGIQMVQAVGAIANQGQMMTPQVVDSVEGEQVMDIPPQGKGQVISPLAASLTGQMMYAAAHQGEAQWAVLKEYQLAGKTGTAQIPIDGQYDKDKTIASFVGFAPLNDPAFVMLVKLKEPQSSPWAAETAAPLWFRIAKELLTTMGVAPSKVAIELETHASTNN